MERSEILAGMGELKLYGMKAAFDQIVTTAVKRQHEPQQVIGDFVGAESRSARSCRSPHRPIARRRRGGVIRRRFQPGPGAMPR